MKSVLVLGSTGLLGSSLVDYLMSLNAFRVQTHSNTHTNTTVKADLTSLEETLQILDEIRPDIIINLIALTNVDECEEKPQRAYLVNTRVVENISVWLSQNSTSVLVHVSTDHLYDGPGENNEENIVLRNYYAFSKYTADCIAKSSRGVVLRTNFFGKSLLLGRASISDWVYDAINNGKHINLFSDVYFSPLSICTLCKMIALVCTSPVPGIYNLGSRDGLSKADFALNFSRILGRKLNYEIISVESMNFKAKRPKNMLMNVSHFENIFNIKLPTLIEEIESIKKEYI